MKRIFKPKSEKGATGVDISTSILLFFIFSSLAFTMYWATFKYVYDIQMHQYLVGYVTDICEKIDLYPYDTPVDQIVAEVNMPNQFTIRNVSEDRLVSHLDSDLYKDIVKKVYIDVAYKAADGEEVRFNVSKVKIREQ